MLNHERPSALFLEQSLVLAAAGNEIPYIVAMSIQAIEDRFLKETYIYQTQAYVMCGSHQYLFVVDCFGCSGSWLRSRLADELIAFIVASFASSRNSRTILWWTFFFFLGVTVVVSFCTYC